MADLTREDEELLRASIKARKRDGQIRPLQKTPRPPTETEREEEVNSEEAKKDTPPKESVQRRRKRGGNFDDMFLQRNETKIRQCAYVDKGLYLKIARIVNVVTNKKVTIGGYLDAIIESHLEEHKDEINEKLINNVKI